MGDLELYFSIFVLVSIGVELILSIVLVPLLNPKFDRVFKNRLNKAFRLSPYPFSGHLRAGCYGFLVICPKLLKWYVPEIKEYNFSSQIPPFTYFLCSIHSALAASMVFIVLPCGLYLILTRGVGAAF